MNNKRILIYGGTGSLGHKLNTRYLNDNVIYNFSRDESKHWKMKLDFNNHKNMNFIIGNIANKDKVKSALIRTNPHIIIIAAAMKHIDQCELNTGESLNNNLIGIQNILNSIEEEISFLTNLETTLFVSSDKACNPINNYGMCKALSETLVVEKSYYIKNIKFVNIRYGNVINSNGSIIPTLHSIGKDINKSHFELTSNHMTRFIMTLEQSVDLIEYAILNGKSGETIIPKIVSMKVIDLFQIFSEKYNKPIKITNLRPGEKLLESLVNETQSLRMIDGINGYKHIKSVLVPNIININNQLSYDSNLNTISKDELHNILLQNNLI